MVQDYIEDKFKLTGHFIQSELPIYLPQYNASGRVDTILAYKDKITGDVKYCGVEVKSKDGYYNEGKFINHPKRGNPNDFRPSDEHLMQSMIYYDAFNTLPYLQQYPIEKWLVMYVMRGTGDYNHFEMKMTTENSQLGYGYPIIYSKAKPQGFVYNKFSIKDIHKRWEELNWHIHHKQLPARDYIDTYSTTQLQQMNNNGELNKANSGHVAAGNFAKCTMTVNGIKEPLGDFACKYCRFKSKCWGYNNRPAEQFDVQTKTSVQTQPMWGNYWQPPASTTTTAAQGTDNSESEGTTQSEVAE